ncbi:MAG: Rpn family recombination-promoting nuclease/putative transposase, partial [Bacilli bacterium]
MKRLNPLNDFLFKKLFSEEENKHLLINFLNAILQKEILIEDLEIIRNTKLTRKLLKSKMGDLDVRAKLHDGSIVNIEVQVAPYKHMEKRSLWYWSRLYYDQLEKGQGYEELKRVIAINILDFIMDDEELDFHAVYSIRKNTKHHTQLTDLLEVHIIEMPKFEKYHRPNIELKPLDRWLLFLSKNCTKEILMEVMSLDKHIEEAQKRLDFYAKDPEVQEMYAIRERALLDRISYENEARREGEELGENNAKIEIAK